MSKIKELNKMTKMRRNKIVEYMCTYCGQKQHRPKSMGRPMPSRCPKRDGKPHRWVINRVE